MGQPRNHDWVYFKLYLGEAYDRCDSLIVTLLPEFFQIQDVERSFFIRYVDDKGFHLRLRFRVRPGLKGELSTKAWGICEKTLRQLPLLPPSDYFPMVPPTGRITDKPPTSAVGIVADVYEPELDKFGGERGISIAEEVFESSSRLALDVLRLEDEGKLSRKTIAPCFMQTVAEAFDFTHSKVDFWQDYSFYWLGGRTPAARDFRERFFAKARTLRTQHVPVVAPPEVLPEEARTLNKVWRDRLDAAASAYARAGDLGPVTPDVLAFNFSHLMNNRLGLPALDEAYLGALLEQTAQIHVTV